MERIAVTGSSGFYARGLLPALRARWPNVRILGLDMTAPATVAPDEFAICDVTSDRVHAEFERFRPDAVVHLAFVVNPTRNDAQMHEVNVGGTKNVMRAAVACGARRFLVSSSATSYGAFSDNAVPMAEDFPLRARDYRYAKDKVAVEQLLVEFEQSNPDIVVSWTRPCMIYGQGVTNYLTNLILSGPLIVLPGGNNTEMQFVHLDDLGRATTEILASGKRGPFNVAPDDWFTLKSLAKLSGRWTIPIPFLACLGLGHAWWVCRLPVFHFPGNLWYFLRYPWVVEPKRLKEELGFRFQHSSHDVLRMLLADHGRLSRSEPQPDTSSA
jgi:UDP-glucose 4-epimerase